LIKSKKNKQAIIIGGASLAEIEINSELKDMFLKSADDVHVVLACRVSPKQKADVV
jgi:magnesium-transporting ATPase (P-type)